MVCFSIEAAQLAIFLCVSSEFCILTSVANMRPPTCSFIFSISSDVQPFKMGVTVTEGHKHSQNEIGSTFFLLCRQKEGKKYLHVVSVTTPLLHKSLTIFTLLYSNRKLKMLIQKYWISLQYIYQKSNISGKKCIIFFLFLVKLSCSDKKLQ